MSVPTCLWIKKTVVFDFLWKFVVRKCAFFCLSSGLTYTVCDSYISQKHGASGGITVTPILALELQFDGFDDSDDHCW